MSRNKITRMAVAAAIAGVSVPMTMAAPAQAKGADVVRAHGSCTTAATWKLKAKHDAGRIEWEFEVDTNHAGRIWSVKVTDNGTAVFSGNRTTVTPSGSFSVERRTTNRSGADVLRARAARGAAICTATVTV